jgi:hypothetical protein
MPESLVKKMICREQIANYMIIGGVMSYKDEEIF